VQVLSGYAVQETIQFQLARTYRLYHDMTTLLTYINSLIQAEAYGLHDTAWDTNGSAVTPFLHDCTHFVNSGKL
jgi:hypothetical protein